MQSPLLAVALAWAFSTLLHTFVAASSSSLTKRNIKRNEGYRCGRRIFTAEFLEKSVKEASNWLTLDVSSITDNDASSKGTFKFDQASGHWHFSFTVNSQSSSDTESYTAVLAKDNPKIVKLFSQRNKIPCIKEPDLSDFAGGEFATGYRCHLAIFPFDIIDKAINHAKRSTAPKLQSSQISQISSNEDSCPRSFGGSSISNEIVDTCSLLWPIVTSGKFNFKASTLLALDDNYNLIGMVNRKKGEYTRCRITSNNQIKPKFIGRALEQQPKMIQKGSLDVFLCGGQYVISDQVLVAATHILERISFNISRGRSSVYPLPFNPSNNELDKGLYMFPITLDEQGNYRKMDKFHRYHALFVVVDGFSDVYQMVIKQVDDSFAECPRTTMPDLSNRG